MHIILIRRRTRVKNWFYLSSLIRNVGANIYNFSNKRSTSKFRTFVNMRQTKCVTFSNISYINVFQIKLLLIADLVLKCHCRLYTRMLRLRGCISKMKGVLLTSSSSFYSPYSFSYSGSATLVLNLHLTR